MAIYRQLFVITALVTSFGLSANPCSTEPTEGEKRELCSGEEHPLAIKLCAESLEIERDKYGRIKAHSYKSDARIPPIKLLNDLCSDKVLKSQAEVVECRQSMRVKRNLDGRVVGYTYKNGDKSVDRTFKKSDRPIVGDGGYLCKEEPKDSLSRKTCIDGLNFDQDGDFMTAYTRATISKFPSDDEAKLVCKKYEVGSPKYEYCKATTQVPRFVDGSIDAGLANFSTAPMPRDFVPLKPICEKKPNAPAVEKLAAKEPIQAPVITETSSAAPILTRKPTSTDKCAGLKGDALRTCVGERTGEQTLISFDSCKTVWDSKSNAKSRLGEEISDDKTGEKIPRKGARE